MDQDYLLTLAAAPIYAALDSALKCEDQTRKMARAMAIIEARALLADVRAQLDAERNARRPQLPVSYSAAGVGFMPEELAQREP